MNQTRYLVLVRRWALGRALVPLLALVTGCGYGYEPRALPAPVSPPPSRSASGFRAGFGRADITPPPGVGLFGYGPESKEARGYRFRLNVRALVLEDARGERIAFVVADLGAISPLLHRLAAQRVAASTAIGADRLVLAATHTHSGPSHFFGAKQFNAFGSSVAGFDTVMVDFLVSRIATAVSDAASELHPARAAWGTEVIWGHTRNRSYEAFVLNDPLEPVPAPPPAPPGLDLSERQLSVDPSWSMLRVDLLNEASGNYEPAGALSIFAIHGTGVPSANDLFDGDVHSIVERNLERHIDNLNRQTVGFQPRAVHLLANGSDGDVSPDLPEETRCPTPVLRRARRPGGPRRPLAPEKWISAPDDEIANCLATARRYVNALGDSLSARAIAIFDRLGRRLASDIRIDRSFRTLPLKGELAPPDLCEEPRVGTASVGGADDGRTRYYGWRFLGLSASGFKQGAASRDPTSGGCHSPKRVFLGPLQGIVIGPHGLPEVAQLMVIRVGTMLLAVVPAEVTTRASERMKAAMREAAEAARVQVEDVALIGLANGYVLYVTTRAEYQAQRYEGSQTIYGPLTAQVFAHELGRLTAKLADDQRPSGTAEVDATTVYPGRHEKIFPDRNAGPEPGQIVRSMTAPACQAGTVVIRWTDAYPGRLIPADGPVLRFERETSNGWEITIWDDDRDLEVRAIRAQGRRGYLWEARWTPQTGAGGAGRHRLVLVARAGFPEVAGQPFELCR